MPARILTAIYRTVTAYHYPHTIRRVMWWSPSWGTTRGPRTNIRICLWCGEYSGGDYTWSRKTDSWAWLQQHYEKKHTK